MIACRSALPLSTEGTKEPKGRKKEDGIALLPPPLFH